MKELLEYRIRIIARLAEAAREFRTACELPPDPFAQTGDGWTVHQIASHTRDVQNLVYGPRIQQTLNTEDPEFMNFDADAWMAEHYNGNEPLAQILDGFTAAVGDLCGMLGGMPPAAWSRLSRHKTLGGGLTLQLWVDRSLAHIEEHLKMVKKA